MLMFNHLRRPAAAQYGDIESRLIRVESKLSQLMRFLGLDVPKVDGQTHRVPVTPEDIGRATVRIETKLHALMVHEGMDPYKRQGDDDENQNQ